MKRSKGGRFVGVRSAQARDKALQQLAELRDSGQVKSALVIAELRDGSLQVLGQEMRPLEIAAMMANAAQGVAAVLDRQEARGGGPPRREAREPAPHGEPVGTTIPEAQRGIKVGADGTLQPPAGETLISCGECDHPRWHVAVKGEDDLPARLACCACGNEIVLHRIHHAEGRA